MARFLFVFCIATLLFNSLALADEIPSSCAEPRVGACEFYRDCAEARYHCGSTGYPIAYGEKYCHRFVSLDGHDLSQAGLFWRDSTLVCLQREIANLLYTSNSIQTCPALRSFAFTSHVKCYTQKFASVCDLPLADWMTITTVVDAGDLASKESGVQVLGVIKTCGAQVRAQIDELLKKLGLTRSRFTGQALVDEALYGEASPIPLEKYDPEVQHLLELQAKLRFIESQGN